MWKWSCHSVAEEKVLQGDLTVGHVVDGRGLQTVIVILEHRDAR